MVQRQRKYLTVWPVLIEKFYLKFGPIFFIWELVNWAVTYTLLSMCYYTSLFIDSGLIYIYEVCVHNFTCNI